MQPDRTLTPAHRHIGVGEVVAGNQGIRVVWAEDPLPVGQRPLTDADHSQNLPLFEKVGSGLVA
jgi:hypothetical protein